jgi:hypothetical protein
MTHFHFDLIGNKLLHFHLHVYGEFQLDRKEIIIDPSIFHFLLFNKIEKTDIVFYIPDNFLRLIKKSQENDEARHFLDRFLSFWGYPYYRRTKEIMSWGLFYENISRMEIKPITTELIGTDNKNYLEEYLSEFKNHSFYISLSPLTNMLGDCIGKMIEFSKRTGIFILSKTRQLARLIREKILSLEIPKRADNIIQAKQNYTQRLFNFQGGQATKFFIGTAIAIGGVANPIVSLSGVLFAFVDP